MQKYSYYRETLNTLTQFTAAFDDCFVWRYTKDFEKKEKINVRYVFGPKKRVLYDIVNQAKNMKLPVVSIEQKNIQRDHSRIQFKDQKISRPNMGDSNINMIPTPIPVIMDLDISIVAAYKEDIDQIAANIIPWCNPYFIISTQIPEEAGMDFIDEIRTEATWSGSIEYENPTSIDHSDKYKIVGNTSFSVKGWMFPTIEAPQAPIYVVNTDFISVSSGSIINGYDDYWSLSANDTTDSILISAYPEFTNTFLNGVPYETLSLDTIDDKNFTFYGKRFDFNNTWYLSSDDGEGLSALEFVEIDTVKSPAISAYKLPDNFIITTNDNIVTISMDSSISLDGDYTFVTANSAAWASTPAFQVG